MPQKRYSSNWYLYILKLANDTYYTGITNNIGRRLSAHKHGRGSKYVRAHLPLDLVYAEYMGNKSNALKREAEIKKLTHYQKERFIAESINVKP